MLPALLLSLGLWRRLYRRESGWSPQFRWAEVCRLSLQNEGVVAHRERAAGRESGDAGSSPACEAPYLRRHLPIEFLDGPLSLGYRLSEKSRAGSNPVPAAILAGFPSRLLSVAQFERVDRMQVTASAIWRRSSVVEHPNPIREVAGSNPVS